MSYEIKTRIKPDMPKGNWTIVARLTDFSGAPYTSVHADFLGDMLGMSASAIESDDGSLYVALPTKGSHEDGVIEQAARPLHLALARLALEPEITALSVETSQLTLVEQSLATSFQYLPEDVSYEFCQELANLALQPPVEDDLFLEIEHLSDY